MRRNETKKGENVNVKNSTITADAGFYAAIRDGDTVSFSQYYESSMPWLVPFVNRITNDIEKARDIAHDIFTKLWLGREQIDPVLSLDGFVAKMATNAALDFVKKKRSHYKYHTEQMFVQSDEDHPADALMVASEMKALIASVIGHMPPQRRKVFELSREKNLTYHEIAEQMGLSYNTVMNYMKTALAEIREVLAIILFYLCITGQ